MEIEVISFGIVQEIIGKNKLQIIGCSNTNELEKKLLVEYPKLKNIKFAIAVYRKIISSNTSLNNGDIVALLPPFAGG